MVYEYKKQHINMVDEKRQHVNTVDESKRVIYGSNK